MSREATSSARFPASANFHAPFVANEAVGAVGFGVDHEGQLSGMTCLRR